MKLRKLKRIKYLGLNLTREVQELYTKNNQTVLTEIKEVIHK